MGEGVINFLKLSGEADKNWSTKFLLGGVHNKYLKSGGSVYHADHKWGK